MTLLPTPRDSAGVHRVDAVCTACDRFAELDLPALVASGYGDQPLVHQPLRCALCGGTGHRIVVSGRSYGMGEVPGVVQKVPFPGNTGNR